jgi:Holliday junction resolvase RusA-like endonuclease
MGTMMFTYAGVWQDDSQIDHLSIRRMPVIGGMLKIKICEVESAA